MSRRRRRKNNDEPQQANPESQHPSTDQMREDRYGLGTPIEHIGAGPAAAWLDDQPAPELSIPDPFPSPPSGYNPLSAPPPAQLPAPNSGPTVGPQPGGQTHDDLTAAPGDPTPAADSPTSDVTASWGSPTPQPAPAPAQPTPAAPQAPAAPQPALPSAERTGLDAALGELDELLGQPRNAGGPTDGPHTLGHPPAEPSPQPHMQANEPAATQPEPAQQPHGFGSGESPSAALHDNTAGHGASAVDEPPVWEMPIEDRPVPSAGDAVTGWGNPTGSGPAPEQEPGSHSSSGVHTPDDATHDLDDLFGGPEPAAPNTPMPTQPEVHPQPAQHEPSGEHAAGGGQTRRRSERVTYRYEPPVQLNINYEQASQVIEMIAQVIGSRPHLAERVSKFELTRDPELETAQYAELTQIISRDLADVAIPINPSDVGEITQLIYDELVGLGPLGVPWRDPDVDEILIDSWDDITVDVNGKLAKTDYRFRSPDHANQVARDLAERVSGRALSRSSPMVTAELPDARIHFVYKPVVKSGLSISLRKFGDVFGMDDLLRSGSLTAEMSDFIFDAVRSRAAVLVSGGTSVGKTTLLNAMSEAIGDHERVVTIEDSYELRLNAPHLVAMQTKEAGSADDLVRISQEDLMKSALRMRPDRIIVGEIRDPAAAQVMLQAAISGHEGTMTTLHADSTDEALNWRLTNLVRRGDVSTPMDIVRWQISEAFDIAVQGRRSNEGHRYIAEVAEVIPGLGADGTIRHNLLFRGECPFGERPRFERVGSISPDGHLVQRMRASGIDPGPWL